VPVSDRKAQVLAHRFARNHFVSVVMLERQWISGFGAFVLNLGNAREELFLPFHGCPKFAGQD
jgi:hypothetical protein